MKIRKAINEDLKDIAPMLVRTQDAHVRSYPERYVTITLEDAIESLALLINMDDGFWVAVEDKKIVGYVVTQFLESKGHKILRDRQHCYLQQIAVSASARGRGIGKRLLDQVTEECRRRGVVDIELDVWGFNSGAQEFFESSGFVPYSTKMRLSHNQPLKDANKESAS